MSDENGGEQIPDERQERLWRASLSLEGLSTGDAFGETFFGADDVIAGRLHRRELKISPWPWTDDTAMAMSIVETLSECGRIDQDHLAMKFAERYQAEPWRGYGAAAQVILVRLAHGASWPLTARQVFGGEGSYGNGGGMRAAPVGAFFADDLARAASEAGATAEITHAHPEGQAGAMAIAVAAAIAARPEPVKMDRMLEAVMDYIPESETRTGLKRARKLPVDAAVEFAVSVLGNGSRVTAMDTVPFAVWCAAKFAGDYEEALWYTVSGLGDRDTTCAMVGGIVAVSSGLESIPEVWRQSREALPMGLGVGG